MFFEQVCISVAESRSSAASLVVRAATLITEVFSKVQRAGPRQGGRGAEADHDKNLHTEHGGTRFNGAASHTVQDMAGRHLAQFALSGRIQIKTAAPTARQSAVFDGDCNLHDVSASRNRQFSMVVATFMTSRRRDNRQF